MEHQEYLCISIGDDGKLKIMRSVCSYIQAHGFVIYLDESGYAAYGFARFVCAKHESTQSKCECPTEYVHQGFAQLTLATVLTLAVVAAAARKAPRATARDRLLLRVALGALCLLTLVVVASALSRMSVYEEAYGFTQLRLLVSFFEGWLGLVVVLVLVAGIRMSGWWIPRAALLSGAAALLAMAALNPDAYVAERNLDRYESTGKIDWYYLSGLSADATPVLADLPADLRACLRVDATRTGDWLEWNLGRARAHEAAPGGLAGGRDCEGSPPR
jgi:hypothetical protein